jgi:hypothetical protein
LKPAAVSAARLAHVPLHWAVSSKPGPRNGYYYANKERPLSDFTLNQHMDYCRGIEKRGKLRHDAKIVQVVVGVPLKYFRT